MCIYVNNVWCISTKMIELYCFTDLEFLTLNCRHFYLPRDFSVVFFTAVHMPPQAITKLVDIPTRGNSTLGNIYGKTLGMF